MDKLSEHNEKRCKLLTDFLRETNDRYDVVQIEYRPERALVYVHFAAGTQMPVEAEGTDTELAARILNRITEKEHLKVPGKA